MTLKEKFLPRMYCFMGSGMLSNTYDKDIAEGNASKCEKIADDHAIDFVCWLMDNCELIKDKETEENVLWSYDSEDYSLDGLLTIFKEEYEAEDNCN